MYDAPQFSFSITFAIAADCNVVSDILHDFSTPQEFSFECALRRTGLRMAWRTCHNERSRQNTAIFLLHFVRIHRNDFELEITDVLVKTIQVCGGMGLSAKSTLKTIDVLKTDHQNMRVGMNWIAKYVWAQNRWHRWRTGITNLNSSANKMTSKYANSGMVFKVLHLDIRRQIFAIGGRILKNGGKEQLESSSSVSHNVSTSTFSLLSNFFHLFGSCYAIAATR